MKNRNSPVPRHVLFEITATRCDLRIGDEVSPETIVGVEYESGEILTAGCHGRVEAVTFSGAEHSLIVVIETASELETT